MHRSGSFISDEYCPQLPIVQNGTWSSRTARIGEGVILNCTDGHIISTHQTLYVYLECVAGRVWNGPIPTCVGKHLPCRQQGIQWTRFSTILLTSLIIITIINWHIAAVICDPVPVGIDATLQNTTLPSQRVAGSKLYVVCDNGKRTSHGYKDEAVTCNYLGRWSSDPIICYGMLLTISTKNINR